MSRTSLLITLYLINIFFLYSQQVLTISKLDSLFIQNNLMLLSKKYNVDAQKALIIQAKLIDNPNIYLEQNIYNSNNRKYFDMSNQGEYIFQFQQIIRTAGKRSKEIKMAELNYQLSQLDFEFLLRTLVYQMHTTFYQIFHLQKIKNIFETEITELEPLVREYEVQFEKGNISLKEVFRLRALLFNLQSINNDINEQLADLKKDLSIYSGITIHDNFQFKRDTISNPQLIDEIKIIPILDTAYKYRRDLISMKTSYELAKTNYSYQKSLKIPDMQAGYTFDKAGNFILNYSAISLGFNLPVFNRNQGNIKAAEYLMKQTETDIKQKQKEIENEIIACYEKLFYFKNLYNTTQKDFLKNFDNIKDGMRENFKKRNISILEYADFFDSYINSVQQYYTLLNKYYQQIETLNYLAGKKIIK